MRNLKLAFRTLFKSPFVAIVAILSLALGIGANAAIYSLFHELLLQPLPVTDPSRLVNFKAPGPQFGSNSCNDAGDCDVPDYCPDAVDAPCPPDTFEPANLACGSTTDNDCTNPDSCAGCVNDYSGLVR